MNSTLKQNNYIVVREFIDTKRALDLGNSFKVFAKENGLQGDPQVPESRVSYNFPLFLELLCEKTHEVSKVVGETVLPTYCYSRVYKNSSDLKPHTDRPSCELSLTVNLGGDKPWEIWITTPEGEDVAVLLNPGDAMIYHGGKAKHWRNTYDGEYYTQVFLHYVYSNGEYYGHYFDRKLQAEIREQVHTDDHIMVIKGVASDTLCDRLVEKFPSDSRDWQLSRIGNNKELDQSYRNCQIADISTNTRLAEEDQQLFDVFNKILRRYKENYEYLEVNNDSGYQILKYETGQFYREHVDAFRGLDRIVTSSIILNDDYEGGEFAFFGRKLKYKLEKGDAIIFPANFMFPHEIMNVTSGTRYSVITWYF